MATDNCSTDEQERRDFGNWLAGFTDAEGYFVLSNEKRNRGKDEHVRRAAFGIGLRADDRPILETIKSYLGCGFLKNYANKGANTQSKYNIRDIDDLSNVIVPLFSKHRLRAKKALDFEIWKEGVSLCRQVKHRDYEWIGYRQGSKPKWRDAESAVFSQLHDNLRATRRYDEQRTGTDLELFDDAFGHWVSGFTAGEGCFDLQWGVCEKFWRVIVGYRLKVRYDDRPIIEQIQKFFGCGHIGMASRDAGNPRVHLLITGASRLLERVIPVFEKYPLRAKKASDFLIWKKGIEMIHEIKARPRINKTDGGHGYYPKWTDTEKNEFMSLCASLKELRRYKGESVCS